MKKRLTACLLSTAVLLSCNAPFVHAENSDYVIATVPKLTAAAWFVRMEEGINDFAEDTVWMLI